MTSVTVHELFCYCPPLYMQVASFAWLNTKIEKIILQSHYPNRQSPDGRWAKNGKIGRRRPIVDRRRHRFWKIFWSADDFFVEAPKLKVSLTDPPIFRGFVIGEASGDGRPMIGPTIGRLFEDFFVMNIGRRSPDHRASIGRRSPDGRSMTFYQRTVGRQTPDIGRHSADDRPTVGRSLSLVCALLFTMHVSTYFMHLFYFGIYFI